ncbi:DNA-directed DNA polymerase II small subunit [Haloarcula litorea]|uniref:DNA-directed DNA polymerase II small subunit n=1 Tax=Haloarcula litorea TaxID=3032579 RepID=UPI0023E8C0A1|nr:DNA-directed DNA polymerase II small subunit [Halomicroarcula sp. GDY20]
MPLETPARIVRELASRGYNAERAAVTRLADAPDPAAALERALETMPESALKLTADHVDSALDDGEPRAGAGSTAGNGRTATAAGPEPDADRDPSVSPGTSDHNSGDVDGGVPVETGGSRDTDPSKRAIEVANDMTGHSTGTGEYSDFVSVFRDRYEKLSKTLRGRVNHRPTDAIEAMGGGSEAALIGMVSDIRSTAGGHWLVELEDTNGTFPCLVMKDRPIADLVQLLLLDEVIAVDGTLADDGGILFVDSLYFPDVPRTHSPSTADRHVQAALISDVHVGSQEFMEAAWHRFADWLHTPEAEAVEYLLVAGDMVEGVGVYPDQDEELDIVDIYEQYEAFSEFLKEVPGDMEIRMIPGNHDAVRLAEPQPGFDEELRDIMTAHDAQVHSNPARVTVEGVTILMYHGVSLDEVIAELPDEEASYDEPHKAMYQLLKKRHVAPQYGGHTRLAPEDRDYLVMEEVPDVFHTGHVHKLGWGKYHNVLALNSGCWQAQTEFQKSVNIDPDAGYAPILDLDTLDMTVRKFT